MMDIEKAWYAFMEQGDIPCIDEAAQVAKNFGPEIRNYCEMIMGMRQDPLGFMLRGEDVSFTARACHIMERWEMPEESITYYSSLAEMFEHRRSFLKLEWHKLPDDSNPDHLVAFYFRRRPEVPQMLRLYQEMGIPVSVLDRIALTALTLEKTTLHFVAGATRRSSSLRHKVYFSQYVTQDSYATVLKHLLEVIELFDIESQSAVLLSQCYGRLMSSRKEQTLFLSISFSNDVLMPSVKIDWPEVTPQMGVCFLPEAEQPQALSEIQRACASVGRSTLSYLGVRMFPDRSPQLKYYLDIV